jgi:signal transduction histidine kinase
MSTQGSQKRILVIDDELGPRESLRFLFKNEFDIHCADCVDHGVEWLKANPPDVIIMDIMMPGKSGIDGLREIRAVDPHVPVIMLTAHGTLETAQEAIRLGANDYLKKPFNTKEMRETVVRHIVNTQVTRQRANAIRELEDLTAQLRVELNTKEHLASLGQASSEFVHDLRSPLTIIYGYTQLLMQDLKAVADGKATVTPETIEYLKLIERNVHRCQEMSELWRSLGQKDSSRMRPTSVAALMEEVLDSAKAMAAEAGARIDLRVGPMDAIILADSLQIFRSIQNLVNNAVHALPTRGGEVRLSWSTDDSHVEIRVEDNGCGIDPDKVDKVLNSCFTTKQTRGGMGIGLFIAKKAVEAHDGTIRLSNRPDKGAMAVVRMPRHIAARPPAAG